MSYCDRSLSVSPSTIAYKTSPLKLLDKIQWNRKLLWVTLYKYIAINQQQNGWLSVLLKRTFLKLLVNLLYINERPYVHIFTKLVFCFSFKGAKLVVLTKPDDGHCYLKVQSLPEWETVYNLQLSAPSSIAKCNSFQVMVL